jgi:hypothetical protein
LAAEAFTLVQRLFQISVDGALPPALVRTWGASKLCLVPKPDSLDVRPICIGDSWYRLLGRVVLRLTSSTIGSRLLPLQLHTLSSWHVRRLCGGDKPQQLHRLHSRHIQRQRRCANCNQVCAVSRRHVFFHRGCF